MLKFIYFSLERIIFWFLEEGSIMGGKRGEVFRIGKGMGKS
jgi:hypothetical protein